MRVALLSQAVRQRLTMTASRYSPGTTMVPSVARLKRAISASRSASSALRLVSSRIAAVAQSGAGAPAGAQPAPQGPKPYRAWSAGRLAISAVIPAAARRRPASCRRAAILTGGPRAIDRTSGATYMRRMTISHSSTRRRRAAFAAGTGASA